MLNSFPFYRFFSVRYVATGLVSTLSAVVFPALLGVSTVGLTSVSAQPSSEAAPNNLPAPTARYANGENVDLADIIAEWRSFYADVPVYLCVCQEGACRQTEQWPYREYDRYQFNVALGPTNGQATEENGFNCFDISDGSRPSRPRDFSTALTTSAAAAAEETVAEETVAEEPPAPENETSDRATSANAPQSSSVSRPVSAPVAPPAPPETTSDPLFSTAASADQQIPTATAINDGADIRLDWPSGRSDVLNVTAAGRAWNLNVLNALDCESLSAVSEKTMTAQRVMGSPAVDQRTGYVAIPVLLDSCVETDQMAVFVVDPTEGGSYQLYRTQLPSVRGLSAHEDVVFPNESSSYAYSTIVDMRYWDSTLLVRQADASGATVISIFRPGPTPAGTYAGCGVVSEGEGATALCNQ